MSEASVSPVPGPFPGPLPPRGRVCQLTPPGRGAVATIRWEGDLRVLSEGTPLCSTRTGRLLHELPLDRVALAGWGRGTETVEEIVVCRVAPDVVELHCHGGTAATARILQDLIGRGGVVETPEELQTRTLPRLEAECAQALQRTTTVRTAAIVAEQAGGLLRRELAAARESPRAAAIERLDALLQWESFGRHLTNPWSVVLCGRPNVGKSSLLNAIAGYARAIVSPLPGTTRDVVTAEIVLDGWPLHLADTAGLRASDDEIEQAGVMRARREQATADLVVLVLDVSEAPTDLDRELLAQHPSALVIAHKSDLPPRWPRGDLKDALAVSSRTGAGLPRVMSEMVSRLVPAVPPRGQAIPVSAALAVELRQLRDLLARYVTTTRPVAEIDNAWRRLLQSPRA